ncbi:unnamed protein product [Moneuplotes crassus]|uniref:Uncharacterized protein n=1 Tax=Euplotes crassus TaxID=5936 RepID=A0AAD1XV18_EUPCR|nr:unnamed protein product [Moneuplotes crassus]
MEKLNSIAGCETEQVEDSKEYIVQTRLESLDVSTLDAVNNQYFNRYMKGFDKKNVQGNFGDPNKKICFKKVLKKGVQAYRISKLSFQNVARCEKMATEFLSEVKVEKINRLYFKGKMSLVDFSFYTRSATKFISKAIFVVNIALFKISHKDFGRILMACNSKSNLHFMNCKIAVDHLDYLDNAHPLITQLDLYSCKIIQPEEDTKDLNGLVQKIAASKLNTCLTKMIIRPSLCYLKRAQPIKKKIYEIGNFTVNIW